MTPRRSGVGRPVRSLESIAASFSSASGGGSGGADWRVARRLSTRLFTAAVNNFCPEKVASRCRCPQVEPLIRVKTARTIAAVPQKGRGTPFVRGLAVLHAFFGRSADRSGAPSRVVTDARARSWANMPSEPPAGIRWASLRRQEPRSIDRHRRGTLVDQVQLKVAQIVSGGGVELPFEKDGEAVNRADEASLCSRLQACACACRRACDGAAGRRVGVRNSMVPLLLMNEADGLAREQWQDDCLGYSTAQRRSVAARAACPLVVGCLSLAANDVQLAAPPLSFSQPPGSTRST